MLTPIEFGMPSKFSQWRPGQVEAIDEILLTDRRFVIICAPTGFGKSIMYTAAAKMSGLRTVICTSTKGLQDQLVGDFGQMRGMVDIRGQSNYECVRAHEFGLLRLNPAYPITVDMGACHSGAACEAKYNGECEYYRRYSHARTGDTVITNYALWMHDKFKRGPTDESSENLQTGNLISVKPVEMLVLDEAHDAPEELASFVGTELRYRDVSRNKLQWVGKENQASWQEWAKEAVGELQERLEMVKDDLKRGNMKSIREAGQWKRMMYKVEKVAGMQGEWAIEEDTKSWVAKENGPSVRFDPLWPKHYAESALFRGVKKIILVSATVRPKTAELLGIHAKDTNFREFPSSFPLNSRPIIHVPTVQMNWRVTDYGILQWIQRIDQLIDQRLDKKGVIHSVSYDRASLIKDNSRHSSRMLLHNSSTRATTVATFKTSPPGTILVSPSVDTGYDFPYSECEYQIISKLPFADNRGKVMKARMKADKEYSNYTTAQTLVQMTGRGMRAEDDKCETLIVDDNIGWFVSGNRKHFPAWWLESYKAMDRNQLPKPLAKLSTKR